MGTLVGLPGPPPTTVSSLSGPRISEFTSFTERGVQSQIRFAIGAYWRFYQAAGRRQLVVPITREFTGKNDLHYCQRITASGLLPAGIAVYVQREPNGVLLETR